MRQDCHTAQVSDKSKKTTTEDKNITQKQQDYNERQKYPKDWTKTNKMLHRGSLRKEGTCESLQLEYGNQLQLHVFTGGDPRTEVAT